VKFIDLAKQQSRIKSNIDKAIKKVLKHGKYIQGPEVFELEEKLAEYTGSKHCISVANGTDALQIAQMALGIKQGDEVITTAFSFVSVAETISLLGAKPVFVDINPETFNLDPDFLESAITPRTKAIIPVSLFGQCADFDEINSIAIKHKIPVIEDGAQSFGALYKNKKSCNLSDIACTSFFPSKPLGCYGDGGAIFTNNSNLAESIRQIATHGQHERYHYVRFGINSRLDTLQAAILIEKLAVLDDEIETRNKIAETYSNQLSGISAIKTPVVKQFNKSVFAQYTIKLSNRDDVKERLAKKDIPSAVHYPVPICNQPAYKSSSHVLEYSNEAANTVLSIPMHPYLSDQNISKIINELSEAVKS